ncbi:MAG: hypothetical protein HWE25_00200 [Alphaproteobacteria bacterium]|nr:hypothetical protein [Alphaproteobacteria bacterium]
MYGKLDAIDRLVQFLIGFTALFSLGFGMYMFAEPYGWYDFVDTVKATGPANAHFIGDIGLAYMVSGLLLGYAAFHPGLRWGAALVGNLWLTGHGLFHIFEVVAGICSVDIFWRDAPGVLGPPLLVFIGVIIQVARQRVSPVPLPKAAFVALIRKIGGKGEPYIDDMVNAGGFMVEKFQHGMLLSGHRYHAPAPLFAMANLGAVRFEDCGPCVEIVRNFAIADRVNPERIANALSGKPDNDDDALAYDFGVAVASGDMVQAADLGDQIEERFGRDVRTELALGAASARLFPALKRGLGYASACQIPKVA